MSTDIIDANNHAFLVGLVKKQAAALDRIAELVALNDDGGWSDMSGILESIGHTVMETGRKVEGWGE